MFGRKKKPIPKWMMQLFTDGAKHWYAWIPLDAEGKLTPIQAKKRDYFIQCFEKMSHNYDIYYSYVGNYFYPEKLTEEQIKRRVECLGSKLAGELPESIGYDGLLAEKLAMEQAKGKSEVIL